MDKETVNTNNSNFYKYSEKGIKTRNFDLWCLINDYVDFNINFKEKFYLFESKITDLPKCYCGNYLKFVDMKKGYRDFCSKSCMVNSKETKDKRKLSCIEKYGVDNPSKSDAIKAKVKQTNNEKFGSDYPLQSTDVLDRNKKFFIDKYGVDNPLKIKEIREKANNTIKKIYGVDHVMLNNEIKDKIKKYFISKYGVDNPSKIPQVREKATNTMISKYGVDSALKSYIFLDKLKNTNFEKYGYEFYTRTDEYKKRLLEIIFNKNSSIVNSDKLTLLDSKVDEFIIGCKICNSTFTIQRQLYRNRFKNNIDICLNCNPIDVSISIDEKCIFNFISNNYTGEIIENYKDSRKEIDVYLPEINLGFEFNGLYWHSELHKENLYHYSKYKFFKEKGITLVNIWEDDWEYKKDIVKSIIINKLGKTPDRIFARKCLVREVSDNQLIRDFLENNHIQGFVGSKFKLGLFYDDELVSLMTFGDLRKSLGQKSKQRQYELLRFCNKLNTIVIGAGSKLFKYFLDNYNPEQVVSYSLNSYSTGNLYEKLGFELISETKNNYFWCKQKKRYHRFNFRKDKLVRDGNDSSLTEKQIMYNNGYYRIFDCGSKKYIFRR